MNPRTFSDLLGPKLGGVVASIFACTEIAEELITEAKANHPDHAEKIDKVFGRACPPPMLRGKSLQLYRAHVAELIAAVVDGKAEPRVTDAMAAAVLSEASLRSPLRYQYADAYALAMSRCFPDHDEFRMLDEEQAAEALADAKAEIPGLNSKRG